MSRAQAVPVPVDPAQRGQDGVHQDGAHQDGDQPEILAMVAPLRRFVASRVGSAHDVDDVVQETLSRVLAVRGRLEDVSLTAYAFTVARNLLASGHRDDAVARRHAPKLVDDREPERPDDQLLAAEERRALEAALDTLPADRRRQLVDHVLNDRPLAELTQSAPSLAAQLGRTRARLRVDYLLALRQVTLTTPRCRQVLLAVSAGDQRRQQALHAGSHLLYCPTCSDLSEPLLQRRRALAGFLPWLPLGTLHGQLVRGVNHHPAGTATVAGTATAVAVAAIASAAVAGQLTHTSTPAHAGAPPAATVTAPVVTAPATAPVVTAPATAPVATAPVATVPAATVPAAPSSAAPSSAAPSSAATATPPAPTTLTDASGPVLPASDQLLDLVGTTVTGRGARVLAVPADEGFWVADSSGRVWVQLRSRVESPLQIKVGQRLDFVGVVVRHDAAFARQTGLEPAEGAALLTRQRAHLEVDPATVRINRSR